MTGKVTCKLCKKNLPKSIYKLHCSGCKSWFHPHCTNLNEVDVKFLLENKKNWTCNECKTKNDDTMSSSGRRSSLDMSYASQQSSTVSPDQMGSKGQSNNSQADIAHLKTLLLELRSSNQSLKDELREIKHSLTFLSDMYDEERSKNKIIADMMQDIKRENFALKKEINILKTHMNGEETRKIMKNVVITGITNNNKENVTSIKEKVGAVLKYIEPAIQEEAVKNILLQNTKNNRPMVIVELDSVERKNSLLKKRKEKGSILAENCNIQTTSRSIYINEHMTSMSYGLLMDAKRLTIAGYSYIWYKNGQIYARLEEGKNAVRIRDSMHIDQLLLEKQAIVEVDT